ncbi:KTN1 protein, partial [Cinclus mexicanus]|nr:KTN1 protein [Cinclus mexicanus]
MEFYESTYFIILIPSVVITVIFLFFWLFMKETLYDEVLAKQRRDLKFAPTKADKKKTEKKKNKKKEAQNGNIHESDSESAPRDFKLSDALGTDEEHVPAVPSGVTEATAGVRERKKKEKKHKANQDDHVTKDSEGSKSSGKKVDPVPVTKQPTPPSEPTATKKKPGQKKQKNGMDDQDSKTDSVASPAKKQEPVLLHQEIKQENVSGKKKVSAKKQKVDNVLVDEPLIQATTYIPLMDNSDSGTLEKREPVEVIKHNVNEGIQKSSGKKLKNETDKENAEVKFKDFVTSMKNMIFSEDEARCVVEVLKEKSGAIHDFLQKASKAETAAALHQLQDKEKMLSAMKEEAAVAKEQCKQLSQELVAEKERNGLLTAKMRERINALEKEHGTFQSKIHVSYQESQQMKIKFQQLREQMEAEISHLKQENGILRDAVSTSTNQMESKQSAELNKLRQDYARLMNELGEKSSKLQQEELQKKNAEQAVAQLKVQQQEAERRWEEIQAYLRKRTAEHEAAQQVQNKLVAKDNEIQSLHSKLTDTMVSKQQLEQRMLQLLEAEQKRATEKDSMQMQVQELIEQNDVLNAQLQKFHSQMAAQTSASVLAEELHEVIAEKDKQIKQMEDSLGNERANLSSKEEELKVLQNTNLSLKSEVQKLQALTNEQAAAAHELERMQKSIHIKDDKIRTLEDQLREELTQISNTKEEVKVLKDQNAALQAEVQKLQTLLSEQVQPVFFNSFFLNFHSCFFSMRERDDKIKTVEELLEAGLIQVATKEEELKALRTENSSLRKELQSLQIQQSEQVVSFQSLVEELQKAIHEKDGKIKSVEELLQAEILKVASKEKTIQALTQEIEALKEEVGNSQLEMEKQVTITSQVKELQTLLKGKEKQLKTMEVLLEEKEKEVIKKGECLQGQKDTIAQLTSKVQELEQQNLQQLQQVQPAEWMLKGEEEQMKLKAVVEEKEREIANQVKQLQDMQKENESFKAQIQELKQENCKQVQLPVAVLLSEVRSGVAGKEKEIASLQSELASQRNAFEQQRKKNNDLREKNWEAMEALASTEKLLQDKVNKTAKEKQQHLEAAEVETRQLLQKLFPKVSLPSNMSHSEWICGFEKMAKEYLREASGSEDVKVMEQKLKEAEEMHILLQLECEKYKSVLAETEGILQRLQRSVEEEESKWKIKVEESQKELKQMRSVVTSLQHEVERLKEENKEVETLKKEREHLESELEKAEIERSTYVSEVRELKDLLTELQKKLDDSYSEAVRQNEELNLLKTQLNETLSKLKVDQNEREKVAGDLPKAQESLAALEREMGKVFGDANVIENSDVCTDSELSDKRRNVAVNLTQDVGHLKKLLASISQMLSKG